MYQLVVRGSCNVRTTGMFDEAMMVELWDSVDTAVMAGTHEAKRGLLGGCDAHTGDKTSVGTLHARLLNKPCSDFLAHTSEVCKGAHWYNEYSTIQG
jgi:hypothetical protein